MFLTTVPRFGRPVLRPVRPPRHQPAGVVVGLLQSQPDALADELGQASHACPTPTPRSYLTIGPYGVLTVMQARKRAIKILAAVFEGKDPAARVIGSGGYRIGLGSCRQFLAEYIQLKRKPKTASSYRYALNRYVLPTLGKRKLLEVTREEVNRLHSSLSAVPYMANRVLAILSSLYSWAERQSLVPERCNPARRIEKYRESRREVFLSSNEL